ncbi:ABC transporter permease [Streptomyces sp. NBC_01465]|uniref:ABC transporter permease n=1 Tax=Streptomyces sp. NBC_01465 TaxID=2903878 RepID=UPI002E34D15C|nr:ABC transporter permease [Streptomyces sp. NBC_01465]
MSATSLSSRPGSRVSGLNWTVLRLHRLALWLWVAYVAVTSAVLLWLAGPGTSGLGIKGTCSTLVANACTAKGPTADTYHSLLSLTEASIGFVPFAAALFAASTLIGRELEAGTAHLAWSQSVSPARWLAAKLTYPAAFLVAGTTVLVLLRRLVASGAPGLTDNQWPVNSTTYNTLGTVGIALPLLGLAIGALCAFLQKRMIPAMGLSFFALLLASVVVGFSRPYLWPVKTIVNPVEYPAVGGDVIDIGAVTAGGAHIDDPICTDDKACLAAHKVVGYYVDYHPNTHFWPLQLVETGLVLALTALVTAIAFRILKRRAAR